MPVKAPFIPNFELLSLSANHWIIDVFIKAKLCVLHVLQQMNTSKKVWNVALKWILMQIYAFLDHGFNIFF